MQDGVAGIKARFTAIARQADAGQDTSLLVAAFSNEPSQPIALALLQDP